MQRVMEPIMFRQRRRKEAPDRGPRAKSRLLKYVEPLHSLQASRTETHIRVCTRILNPTWGPMHACLDIMISFSLHAFKKVTY